MSAALAVTPPVTSPVAIQQSSLQLPPSHLPFHPRQPAPTMVKEDHRPTPMPPLHIVVMPYPAFGHLRPFLDLSARLAARGHRVSFLATPTSIRRLLLHAASTPPALLRFVPLSLPRVDSLPAHVEVSSDLPSDDLFPYFNAAVDSLRPQLSAFLEAASPRPDWLLADFSPDWTAGVAAEFGVPSAFVGLFSAAAYGFYGPVSALMGKEGGRSSPEDLTVSPEWVPFPTTVRYRLFEARTILEPAFPPDYPCESEGYRLGSLIDQCQVVAMRSCRELEPEWLHLLGEIYQKPVIPIGLLPPPPPADSDSAEVGGEIGKAALDWLALQKPGSIIYVGFGSELTLSAAQVSAIAGGLEISGLGFLWAYRTPPPPQGEKPYGSTTAADIFPAGFEERTIGRGLVCRGWVPQRRVLSHRSTGAFLTHCGWNSVVEALQAGLPLALLPVVNDEGLNARMLEEKGLGREVSRDDEDGSFTAEDLAETLRLVMACEEEEEGGGSVRAKAREMSGVVGDAELQDRYFDKFVEYLMAHRGRPVAAD